MSMTVPDMPLARQDIKVSFQSPTANAWGMSYLRHFSAELDKVSREDHRQLMAGVGESAQALFNSRFHTLPDVPSYTVLGTCALILFSYRALLARSDSASTAIDVVERSFDKAYQEFILNVCKPLLLNSGQSLQSLARMNFGAWSERMYRKEAVNGGGEKEVALDSDVSGYHHFFMAQDEPGLAQIIHAADQAWIQAIAAHVHSQWSERRRSPTRSTGFCFFHFGAKTRGRTECRADVVLELQITSFTNRSAAGRRNNFRTDRRMKGRGHDAAQSWSFRNYSDRRERARV